MGKSFRVPFAIMFSIVLLLNVGYAILRSVRHTLAVVDLGTSAKMIPWFELLGVLPCSILMTWGLSMLMRRYSMRSVFVIVLSTFVTFFFSFSMGLYPFLESLRAQGAISPIVLSGCASAFYVMGELWNPALLSILFWGLVNQYIAKEKAKMFYAPLISGGSLGVMLSNPLITFCTSVEWSLAFMRLMWVIVAIGLTIGWLYFRLERHLRESATHVKERSSSSATLQESLTSCVRVLPLRWLSGIVIAEYLAYTLVEVVFYDVLKMRFPTPCEYCSFMGLLSLCNGALTLLSALVIAPVLWRRCRWVTVALITPLCLLVIEMVFFVLVGKHMVFGKAGSLELQVIVFWGSMLYCVGRAMKYTLFDSSEELAFVSMNREHRMQGKLVIDGICSRTGKAGASVLSLCSAQLCGGVVASAPVVGPIAMGMIVGWLWCVRKLGAHTAQENTTISS